jgi:cardiolipin synthase
MDNHSIKFSEKLSKGFINRSLIIVILLVLQVLLLGVSFVLLAQYIHYIYLINLVISLFVVVYIVNRKECPEFKIAWLAFMCLLPIFGMLYYQFIELNPKQKRIVAKIQKTLGDSAHLLVAQQNAEDRVMSCAPAYTGLLHFLRKQGPYPVYDNSEVQYFDQGEKAFEAVKSALRSAKSYIFMEYFVVSPGRLLDEVIEILREKAAEGVEIRLMYDGLCHAKTLSYSFPKLMREYGVKVNIFEPFSPFLSSDQNYRDHRKITVVDGEVAFTGGFNLADEYVNFTHPFGHWKDVAVQITGEAVRTYTVLFLQNWQLGDEMDPKDWETYFPQLSETMTKPQESCDKGFVAPYADSPNVSNEIGITAYMGILDQAKDYVWIMTPYLVPDNEILKVITFATGRGVDVRIIIPHIPDKKIPFAIARSFYPELLKAGVKVYEYTPGFVHAKVFISDDRVATVGSYNLDYRSFYLNYEVGSLLIDCPAVKEIHDDFKKTLSECQEMALYDYRELSWGSRISGRVLRLFGPLL